MSVSSPSRLVIVARDIKLSHSVFAMPFALLATFLAAGSIEGHRWPAATTLVLIVICMVLARTAAMAFNRWADRRMDAANPRTARRALASGALSPGYMLGVIVVCGAAFIAATAGFWLLNDNPWPLILSPFVLAWLCLYSLTKRFTWFCHVFLGSSLALSPVAAAIAVQPGYLARPEVWLLAGNVLCWVAGFDIIYALQDVAFDREHGVFSMPANLGVETALWISRGLHLCSAVLLTILAATSDQFGLFFTVAVVLTIGLLILEHVIVWRSSTHHIDAAFLTVNGVISLLLGAAGIIDLVR